LLVKKKLASRKFFNFVFGIVFEYRLEHFTIMKLTRFFGILSFAAIALSFTSCVDIFDEIIMHNDGSGTFKYTINLSSNKVKVNSILALDSVNGKRVPKLPEIKEKIALYKQKLENKEGISNVKVDANYEDFVFKFSCDFASVDKLQDAIKEIIKEESKDKNNPALDEKWLSWDGKQLIRSVPDIQAPIQKLSGEDQEGLKAGKYIAVTRFDSEVVKVDNAQAQISPSKTAVMIKSTPYAVSMNPSLLKNTISIGN